MFIRNKQHAMRLVIFAVLLTMLAWMVPANIGQASAATADEPDKTLLEQTINVQDSFAKTYGDAPFDLEATAPGDLTYSSNNRAVATVSDLGIVTIKGVGTATITIIAGKTDTYEAAMKTVRVTVGKGIQTISCSSTIVKTLSDQYSDTHFRLEVSASGFLARLSYESSDPTVATVDPYGFVTIVGAGTTIITVKASETSDCLAATKDITLTVEKPGQTISGPATLTKSYGDSPFNLGVTAKSDLSYTSSNPDVATVDSDGTVTITGVGTTTITVKAAETSTLSAANKTIQLTVEKSGQMLEGETAYRKSYGDSSFKLNAKAEGALTYTSQNPEVATVGRDGTVTIMGVGTAVIEVTAAATSTHETVTKLVTITVEKGKQLISGTSSFTKKYGSSTFSLGATAKGELSYQSSNSSVATVSENGIVTIKGTGKATITIMAAETELYAAATKKVSLTVNAQKPKAVTMKSAKSAAAGAMTVSWNKVSGASGYQIVVGKNKSCTSGKKVKNVSASNSSATITGLTKNTTYYAKVRAYQKVSGKTYYGAYSKVKSVKIKASSIRLKDYQKKSFYSKIPNLQNINNEREAEVVYINFGKASGKKIKLSINNGYYGTGYGYDTGTITGTLSGNKIQFKNVQCYSIVEVNGGLDRGKIPVKLSGTITFINKKAIKITISSRYDPEGWNKDFKMLKAKKTVTLKPHKE